MPVVANLIGFDGDAFSYISSLSSDNTRRFILHVFTKVDSRMDRPIEWPAEPFDCVFFARSLEQLAEDSLLLPLITEAAGRQVGDAMNTHPHPLLMNAQEAADYISTLKEGNTSSMINLLLSIVGRLIQGDTLPEGQFDLLYLAQTTAEAFSRSDIVRIILTGEGHRTDWW